MSDKKLDQLFTHLDDIRHKQYILQEAINKVNQISAEIKVLIDAAEELTIKKK